MKVLFTLRPDDSEVLLAAARKCGISLNEYIQELAEVRAAEIRIQIQEESRATVHR